MCSINSLSTNACRQAGQLFITVIIILLLGKVITLVPVMNQLQLSKSFNAAEIVWFFTKLAALIVFFLFARSLIKAIPNNGGILSFVKGIAEPLAVLMIAIMGQALLWQLLVPFLNHFGRTMFYSIAILLIVCVSIWLVLRAYQNALYLVDAMGKIKGVLSRVIPHQHLNCEQCSKEISAQSSFCSHCGYKVKDHACCSKCGEKIVGDQTFCQNCGVALIDDNQDSVQE